MKRYRFALLSNQLVLPYGYQQCHQPLRLFLHLHEAFSDIEGPPICSHACSHMSPASFGSRVTPSKKKVTQCFSSICLANFVPIFLQDMFFVCSFMFPVDNFWEVSTSPILHLNPSRLFCLYTPHITSSKSLIQNVIKTFLNI